MSPRVENLDPVEVAVADLAVAVRKIQGLIPLLDDLVDTRQAGLTFIPQATLQVMGEQYAKDQRARREAEVAGYPTSTGASPAPGNLQGWTLLAEVTFTLRDQLRRIISQHKRNGVTLRGLSILFGRGPGSLPGVESTAAELASWLYELVWTLDRPGVVQGLERDLEHLARTVEAFIDGEDRMAHPGACPYCGNKSLVIYKHSGVIRCERPRDHDGTRPACHCASGDCPCRADREFVHSWLREAKRHAPNSWHSLQDLITTRTTHKETSP